jgi:prephenate dehydrogenase
VERTFVTIGLIGHGRFGKLTAKLLARHANVYVYDSRRIRGQLPARKIQVRPLSVVASQELVVLAVPISALEATLHDIRPFVNPGALVLDVCSVKVQPVRWMRKILPRSSNVLGTHPLFGPDSVSGSLRGRKIVLCPVRIPEPLLRRVCEILKREGLEVSVLTPSEHDRMVAETLLLTQYVGRLIHWTGVQKWKRSTLHFEKLLDLVHVAERDSVELFRDMWNYNPYAARVRRKLDLARRRLQRELALTHVPRKA